MLLCFTSQKYYSKTHQIIFYGQTCNLQNVITPNDLFAVTYIVFNSASNE